MLFNERIGHNGRIGYIFNGFIFDIYLDLTNLFSHILVQSMHALI